MEALLAFVATLVSLRLSADLVRRHRASPAPGLLAWAAALGAFAAGSGAIAWGSAAGWGNPGLPGLLPLRRPARGGAARRGLAPAGRRPRRLDPDPGLRRACDRRRDRRAADNAGHGQLDPRGAGAPRALPGPGARDRRELARHPRRRRRRRDRAAAPAARERARSSPASPSPPSAAPSRGSARPSRLSSPPLRRCSSTQASSLLLVHRRLLPDAHPGSAGAAP